MGIKTKHNKNCATYEVTIYLTQDLQLIYKQERLYKTFTNLKEARKWEKDRQCEVKEGFVTTNEEITIKDAGEKFLNAKKLILSPNTLKTFKGYISKYYISSLKNKPLSEFTYLDIKRFNSFLEKCDVAEKTKHNNAACFRTLLKWAEENNFVDEDIITHAGKYSQKPAKEKDYLNREELTLLLSKIEEDPLRDIITFLAFTGLRISELCGFRFADIDFESKTMIVRNQIYLSKEYQNGYIRKFPKRNHISSVPLNVSAFNILKKLKRKNDTKSTDFIF